MHIGLGLHFQIWWWYDCAGSDTYNNTLAVKVYYNYFINYFIMHSAQIGKVFTSRLMLGYLGFLITTPFLWSYKELMQTLEYLKGTATARTLFNKI